MEREFFHPQRRTRGGGGNGGSNDHLNEVRSEVDGLYNAADHIFDSINNIQAQEYLEQNLQTGGQ